MVRYYLSLQYAFTECLNKKKCTRCALVVIQQFYVHRLCILSLSVTFSSFIVSRHKKTKSFPRQI